ncbi:MAG TPA: selenocysteine-specific translation elongation factor [Solirubrobacteraceae bacterium]|jgi:selenocysteine-specific elongation factor
MSHSSLPLTVGTAGHIDHGKTALVRLLTGVETDRLPEEKARGISIALGYAPLRLPSGRELSLVDVPGHERLIRVMVSGATGIDLFLLVIAADDAVMPQTLEHLRVLQALGVAHGVVAVTKADLADPARAAAAACELLPGTEVVACSARTGDGIEAVARALERAAAGVRPRAVAERAAALHVDRVFTIAGAGTVVTGTLWSGRIGRGDQLTLLPSGRPVRVRGVQVHERGLDVAMAGQRVAVNLAGLERRAVARGDALVGASATARPTYRLTARLNLQAAVSDRERVQLHHGTRDTPARAVRLADGLWQLRAERPVIAADGDRVVLRRISPPDTLGGGIVVTADAGGRPRPAAPRQAPTVAVRAPLELDAGARALEQRLRAAAAEPPSESELGEEARHLPALREAGRVVRVGRSMYAHTEAIEGVQATVERIIDAEGEITLARLRDELHTSRKFAQALLEHLDAARVTLRRDDDTRVLRRSRGAQSAR